MDFNWGLSSSLRDGWTCDRLSSKLPVHRNGVSYYVSYGSPSAGVVVEHYILFCCHKINNEKSIQCSLYTTDECGHCEQKASQEMCKKGKSYKDKMIKT